MLQSEILSGGRTFSDNSLDIVTSKLGNNHFLVHVHQVHSEPVDHMWTWTWTKSAEGDVDVHIVDLAAGPGRGQWCKHRPLTPTLFKPHSCAAKDVVAHL